MSREHDLNGYIIMFTSNFLSAAEFQKCVPAELRSRIDMVCEFQPLSASEKREYVDYEVGKYMAKLATYLGNQEGNAEVVRKWATVDCNGTENLREIKRMIQSNVCKLLDVENAEKYVQM